MLKLRNYMILTIITFMVVSCAASSPTYYDQPVLPVIQVQTEPSVNNDYIWGTWEGTISADRTSIDLVPNRSVSTPAGHYNVLLWLEYGPCYDCVQIIDKQIIDANRVNITVQIKHPFPGLPQFTGFDVYGGIQFPGTILVTDGWPTSPGELMIAWRYDNAAQVLNPHGYDTGYSTPDSTDAYDGFIPGKLGGEVVDPLLNYKTLVWPYRIFRTTPVRNMFEVWGTASQTYELWLPEGEEVKFGYVVTSKWVPPDTLPVTDPASQFPREANMGVYGFEVLETTGPASSEQDATILFRVYYHSCKEIKENSCVKFFTEYWQYFSNGGVKLKSMEKISESPDEGVDEFLLTLERTPDGPDKGPPGLYPFPVCAWIYNCIAVHPNTGWFVFEIEAAD